MKLGSLFDGSGGFPLAGQTHGIVPRWASEVEAYPIAVTCKNFPDMVHLGDISKVKGADIEPVDIVTFGSPCQDLSVAGQRKGMKHESQGDDEPTRSGLFYEAIRLIEEMRDSTDGVYPRIAIWENVHGAFSSNKGEDFRTVLEAFAQIVEPTADVPRPADGWANAGGIVGVGWSIAWRVFDAQYWGVPQRRRRIFLVADLHGDRAGNILFERMADGTYNFSEAPSEPIPSKLSDILRNVFPLRYLLSSTACHSVLRRAENRGKELPEMLEKALVSQSEWVDALIERYGKDALMVCGAGDVSPDVARTLSARHDSSPCDDRGQNIIAFHLTQDPITDGIAPCISSGNPNNGQATVGVVYGMCSMASNSMKSSNPHSGFYEADTVRTLDANGGNPTCNQGGMFVVFAIGNGQVDSTGLHEVVGALSCMHDQQAVVFCIAGNIIDRSDTAGANGVGVTEDVAYTLNTIDRHAVAAFAPCQGAKAGSIAYGENVSPALKASSVPAIVLDFSAYNQGKNAQYMPQISTDGIVPTLIANGPHLVCVQYIVRRLMPIECARLQGFADDWGVLPQISDMADEDCAFWQDVRDTYAAINGKTVKTYTKAQMIAWYNKLHSDGAEYKMWGNGVALLCVDYVLGRVAEVIGCR